jgi:CHAT domain-containing protein/tetratricopeptide (TPR) repeat protein
MPYLKLMMLILMLFNVAVAQERELTPEEQAKLEEAEQYNLIAVDFYQKGQAQQAIPYAEKVFNICKDILGEKHPGTLTSLNNLASIYQNADQLKKALPMFEKSYLLHKQVLGEKNLNTLTSQNNLAMIYKVLGKLDDALVLYEESYALHRQVLGKTHPDTLKILEEFNNLANDYYSANRHNDALSLYEKNYLLRKQILGEKHHDTLISLGNLSLIYKVVGKLDQAMPLYEKAYRLKKQVLGETHPNTLTSLNNLAIAYAQQDHLEKSIDYLEQLITDVENLRQTQLSVETRRAVFAQYIGSYFDLSQIYFLQNNLLAFHTAEKTKARTLLESIAFKLALQQVDFTAEERQKIEQQQTQLAFLDTKIAETSELDKRTALRIKKQTLLEQITAFHNDLKQRYPVFALLLEPEIITATKGQHLLPKNSLFVSYLQNPVTHQLLVFILEAGKLYVYYLGTIAGLEQTLTVYRQVLGTTIMGLRKKGQSVWQLADGSFVMGDKPARAKKPRRVKHVDEISRYLAAQLLQPIAEQLKTKSHWIISPSGALAQIPFETLILANNQPVIANYNISYAQSLSTFAMLKKRETAYQQLKGRKTLLAMGNPRYHDKKAPPKNCNVRTIEVDMDKLARGNHYQETLRSANKNWCNLPGTQQELEVLKNLYPDSTIYQQADASEARLQQLNKANKLTNYRYLHFATHGFLHSQTSALSALVLDQLDTTDEYDGYLTAVEWIGYQLKSDLMVLSACQTGLGETVSGEGIMGLPYALYIAGNKNTLMTLWKVDDAKTAEFMRRFFTKLNHGTSHIRALTETKREFMQAEKYQNPIYWAAFVLYGV